MPAVNVPKVLATPQQVEAIVEFGVLGTFDDAEVKGLYLRAGPRTASFYFHSDKQVRGKRMIKRLKLGPHSMGLVEARRRATIEAGDAAAGKFTPGKIKARKVSEAFDEYLAKLLRNVADPKTGALKKPARWHRNASYLYKQLIEPRWAGWSLIDLVANPRAVRDWHLKVTKSNGPVSANKAAQLLRSAYLYAAKEDTTLPQRMPTSMVEWNPEEPAQTSLSFKDFPAWLAAWTKIHAALGHNKPVRHFAPTRKQFHLFGLFTGMRPGEISRLTWGDVKPKQRELQVPNTKASTKKKARDIYVIMSAPIARILKRCRDITKPQAASELIFPHCGQVASRDKLPARGHDLRHTWKTVATECKVSDLLSGIMLGHAAEGVSEKYITDHVLREGTELRASQRKVSARMVKLLGRDPTKYTASPLLASRYVEPSRARQLKSKSAA